MENLQIHHVSLRDITVDVLFFTLQLDEDIKTILQRYEGIVEEDSEQTSNEATLSYLDYLANLDSEEVRQEVAKRSAATKEHTRKLLHYVEISGPYSSTVSKEKPNSENQAEEEGHKGAVTQENFCLFSAKKNCWYIRLNSIVMACYRVVIKF